METQTILLTAGGTEEAADAAVLARALRGAGYRIDARPAPGALRFVTPGAFGPPASGPAGDIVCTVAWPETDETAAAFRGASGMPRVSVFPAGGESGSAPIAFGSPGQDIGHVTGPTPTVAEVLTAVLSAAAAGTRGTDLAGRAVLVTAGPTVEDLDPVRFLSNRSSGKMGLALALGAVCRGAEVVLVHGPLSVPIPRVRGLLTVSVRAAAEMRDAVLDCVPRVAAAVLCAAVADFAPAAISAVKIKKTGEELTSLPLTRTTDILATIGQQTPRPFLVGFAAENTDLLRNAEDKLRRKNCDLICANDIGEPGSGFRGDTNRITILRRGGAPLALPLLSKHEAAHRILDEVAAGLSSGDGDRPRP